MFYSAFVVCKVRKTFRNQEVYDNFLRCLHLFNQEVIQPNDLVHMVQPFFAFVSLHTRPTPPVSQHLHVAFVFIANILTCTRTSRTFSVTKSPGRLSLFHKGRSRNALARTWRSKSVGDSRSMFVCIDCFQSFTLVLCSCADFSSCRRCGSSYRALPKSYPQPKCSGRTALCREVCVESILFVLEQRHQTRHTPKLPNTLLHTCSRKNIFYWLR